MTLEQIQALVAVALRETLPLAIREALPPWYVLAIALGSVILGGAIVAFCAPYLQTKGHRLATREDLGKVEGRVEAIRADIAGGLWLRQRRWELRYNLYSETLEALMEIEASLQSMLWAREREKEGQPSTAVKQWRDVYVEAHGRMSKALDIVMRNRVLGGMLMSRDALAVIESLGEGWNRATADSGEFTTDNIPGIRTLIYTATADFMQLARSDVNAG